MPVTKPIIAIVGRPNVGKSTLFNRLVGKRLAIVEDFPGTTRDRAYSDITWKDQVYTLIDTGGLELSPESSMSEKIRDQVDIAIEEADAIIMLVDVKDGLTIPDQEIAETLRRSKRNVVLAVNKCENEERINQAIEFFQVPLEDPVIISAYHGNGVSDLMDKVVERIPPSPPPEYEADILKIAILGRPNAGKSMLLNSLLGQERVIVSDVPGTTRDSIDTIVERGGKRALLIDTAGIRRRGRIGRGIEKYSVLRALRAIDRADICLLMLDASDMVTAQDAHIAGFIRDAFKGILIVVNKWDLADELALRKKDCSLEVSKSLKFLHYAPMVFISAKTGSGINQILSQAEQINQSRLKRIDHAELKRAIMHAYESHPPMTKRHFQIRDVIQPDTLPPTFVFAVSNPTLVHFTYRRYLENSLRTAFGLVGTPLKLVFKMRIDKKKKP
jgi:GTPase